MYDKCLDGRREEKMRGKFVYGDFVDFIREYEMRLFLDAADADHDGYISFEDLQSACEARNMNMSVPEMATVFMFFDGNSDGRISKEEIKNALKTCSTSSEAITENVRKVMAKLGDEISKGSSGVGDGHRESFKRAAKEMAKSSRTKWTGTRRWRPFIHFERMGLRGERAMHGGDNLILDVLPGRHSVEAIVDFGDLPSLKPFHLEVAGVEWQGSSSGSGRVFFPWSFSGALPLEMATGELLSYYGCRIANSCAGDILLDSRHAIQDFTYSDNYLEDYVVRPRDGGGNGGSGRQFNGLEFIWSIFLAIF